MSETKHQFTADLALKAGGVLAAVSVAWAVMDSRGQAAQKTLDDHEIRLRAAERSVHELRQDYLTGVLGIKGDIGALSGDLGVVKSRLTGIEKAVKP